MLPSVLMVIHQFRPIASGAEMQVERLAGKLVSLGHQVAVLTQLRHPASLPFEMLNGIAVHRVDFPLSYWTYRDIGKQFRFLVKNRHTYDIIHSHQCFNHAVVNTLAAQWLGKKSILKIACAGEVGDLRVFSQFRGFNLVQNILHQTDAVIAISAEIEKELHEYGFPAEHIYRIPNGVDTDEFKRRRPFPERSKIIFLLIGRRTPQKGVDIAFRAMQTLLQKGINNLELRLYGLDYPEYDNRRMAQECGVQSAVRFYPYTENIHDVYHDAHCLLLPSRTEGLSNVLLEAMSLELPVIATRISGTVDVVEHEKSGILIASEDAEALAVSMEEAMKNPALTLRLGENARQRIIDKFSLDEVARNYSGLYQRLMEHG
jgi:glycosyltransferase involved in cell wall biosynthesis